MNINTAKVALTCSILFMLAGCSNDADALKPNDASKPGVEETTDVSKLNDELLPYVGEVFEQDDFYTVYYTSADDSYLYEIYDPDGNCILRDITYKYNPGISLYDSRYIEIHQGAGTDLWYCTYIDLDTRFMTEPIESAVYIDDGMVGKMFFDENGSIAFRLFIPYSYSDYSEVVRLDFYRDTAVPAACLRQIGLTEEGKIQIEYLNEEGEFSTAIIEIER